ncbi:MAG: glycoside hydrolase [Muribaculaceae bacterium]|nr:glycoside hydrolase [Muribaculaceae bacterium]
MKTESLKKSLVATCLMLTISGVKAQNVVMADVSDVATQSYEINPDDRRQVNEGWGVSLAWWANMCGKWSDDKIDKIIDWLVSPTGLNYNVFRYNIGGGDAPGHNHMADGKGIRAQMEGFKDSSDGEYIWTRDAAQRKIMLKIREKRPDAIFEAFSNTPPYYMTISGCASGNSSLWGLLSAENLSSSRYEEFARYLVDVCKHYKDEYGIEFRTLEPFNEPSTEYWKDNGDQEGCKFSVSSQVKFIKVLYPILQASGLNTVISASDETNVSSSITGFNQYKSSNILDMIGQWNTHTYAGTTKNCTDLNALVRAADKRLWMSESGPLTGYSDGLKGCLELSKRLFDDVRYLGCDAWIDWQYIEEWNEQWCTVKADFANQTYERVKNYYVRQQVSRFIGPGYRFVASPNDYTLAAISPEEDTLVLVALNTSDDRVRHECRLVNCEVAAHPSTYFTSAAANMMKTACDYNDGVVGYTLPAQSIATFIIPLKKDSSGAAPVAKRPVEVTTGNNMLTVKASGEERCNVAVYSIDGKCRANVDFVESVAIPVVSGYYIVRVSNGSDVTTTSVRVN